MGSTVEVERATAGATQLTEVEQATAGATQLVDTGAVPLPPPPPLLRVRDAVRKLLCPHSSQNHQAKAPALAPRKALKAALRHGAASAKADLKEPVAQGEATEAATKQVGEEAPMLREARALESGEAEAPSIAEATEGEVKAPRTSEAKVAEARASRASKAEVANAEAPRTTEAEVAKAGAPRTTEAEVVDAGLATAEAGLGAAKPAAQDAEMEAGQALVPPLVQDPPPSQENTWEVEPACLGAGLNKEVSHVAEASVIVQAVLEAEIQERKQRAAHTACEALEVRGVESGSSLGSRLIALSGRVNEWLRGALHMGIKRTLAVVSSHYAGIDLEAVSDGYVMAKDDEKAEEEVMKLVEVAKAPSTVVARLFEEEVVPPTPTADAGDPEF
ncbi:uncharacterized protein [Miscanthus floridulus]|uniref:uncharacterized protein n=1 Tax=Miscanthus floridulus TaxID=154761 RepID=UPI003457F917